VPVELACRQVEQLANLAVQSGLGGVVCSPLEIVLLRQFLSAEFQLVTPGIRSGTAPTDDQPRTSSAREALQVGSNRLVIGRPIHTATDPRAAARGILRAIEKRPPHTVSLLAIPVFIRVNSCPFVVPQRNSHHSSPS
jgi:orotidine-5'-phosphate decarboxylase